MGAVKNVSTRSSLQTSAQNCFVQTIYTDSMRAALSKDFTQGLCSFKRKAVLHFAAATCGVEMLLRFVNSPSPSRCSAAATSPPAGRADRTRRLGPRLWETNTAHVTWDETPPPVRGSSMRVLGFSGV